MDHLVAGVTRPVWRLTGRATRLPGGCGRGDLDWFAVNVEGCVELRLGNQDSVDLAAWTNDEHRPFEKRAAGAIATEGSVGDICPTKETDLPTFGRSSENDDIAVIRSILVPMRSAFAIAEVLSVEVSPRDLEAQVLHGLPRVVGHDDTGNIAEGPVQSPDHTSAERCGE